MLDEFLQHSGLLGDDRAEDPTPVFVVQRSKQRDRIVRSQQGKHPPQFIVPLLVDQVVENARDEIGLHLGQSVGGGLVVHLRQNTPHILLVEAFQGIGRIRSGLPLEHFGHERNIDRGGNQRIDAFGTFQGGFRWPLGCIGHFLCHGSECTQADREGVIERSL